MLDLPRLKETLGTPELAWLLQRIRQRFERGQDSVDGVVTLRSPTTAQREAVDSLLGRKPTGGTAIAVRLEQLSRVLAHARLAGTLREAIEALTGPVANRRAIRDQSEAQWASLFEGARDCLGNDPAKISWLETVRSEGLLRRLSGGDMMQAGALMDHAVRVVSRLPEQGILLTTLAAEVAGDSHALDAGSPLSTLAIRAAAALAGEQEWSDAEARRRVWDEVGVVCDEYSAPVLVLNLYGDCSSLSGKLLSLCAQHGEPCRLTAGLLIRHPWVPIPAKAAHGVYVCENPSVLAAAARVLGPKSSPLVCIDGQPSTAAHLLLRSLSKVGVQLRYHGDFDWGGIRIANLAMKRYGALPWRMSADDYLAAVRPTGLRLADRPVVAQWDGALSDAMLRYRKAVHEEQIASLLLSDLDERP